MSVLSICSGIGGIELGLSLVAKTRVLGFVEREAFAAAVLLARMEDSSLEPAPIWCGNLEQFDARPFAGVDLVTAGLPCQPYSLAGKREGDRDERAIWPELIRIVSECRPAMVFLENVPAFVAGGFFRRPGEELSRLGYRIERPLFLRASDLGAPHRRERVFILAHRIGTALRIQPGWSEPVRASEAKPGYAREELADPTSRERGKSPERGGLAERGGATLDHSASKRRDYWQPAAGAAEGTRLQSQESRGRCSVLADSDIAGYEGRTEQHHGECQAAERSREPLVAFDLWPPGPAGDWSRIPEVLHPARPKSKLRCVAHGLPFGTHRMDELRAFGNAVVPAMAGAAFEILVNAGPPRGPAQET